MIGAVSWRACRHEVGAGNGVPRARRGSAAVKCFETKVAFTRDTTAPDDSEFGAPSTLDLGPQIVPELDHGRSKPLGVLCELGGARWKS